MKKTKIICTIGPTSQSINVLRALIRGGVDALRINLSHTPYDRTIEIMKSIRKISKNIPLIIDSQGKEVRVGAIGEVQLIKNQKIRLYPQSEKNNRQGFLYITRPEIFKNSVNEVISIDDHDIRLKISKLLSDGSIECVVLKGGKVSSPKTTHLTTKYVPKEMLTERDKKIMKQAGKFGITELALSYINNLADIKDAKKHIGKKIKITSKIETLEAVKNIDSLIKFSDNISIDRKDLGTEIGYEKIPIVQKFIIKKCLRSKKPIFVATNILDTMIHNNKPSRGEVNDIISMVLDGATGLILSSETSIGKNPVKIFKTLKKIVKEAEFILNKKQDTDSVIERLEELNYV
jgi:pyruvate kinase